MCHLRKAEWDVDTRCLLGGGVGGDMKTSYGLGDKSQSVWVNKRHLSIITKATGVPRSREG